MHVDDSNGDPSVEPIVDPTAENGYDDDYQEEDEGVAEYGEDDVLYAPATDAAERLRGLVAYLASNLVDDPEHVEVEARQRGGSVFISLRVPEEELGKVIGRGGRIARAMRTALMIAGSRNNVRASLDIED
ncbi:MAG: hypothetical protein K0S78_6416 [Thermomicrobiales bacterium]|jgi:predicted RNA-binding protein YlqC (UPF0109 family)|nr:hypothetical protein [Thermomicrobiales bacterium]